MNWHRDVVIALSILLAVGASAIGQEAQKVQKKPGAAAGDSVGGPLLPKGFVEKVNLTAEQKEKIAKFEKEFAEKAKDTESKLREKIQKARADKDKAAMKAAQDELAEAQKLRETYVARIRELLTDEQKKGLEKSGASEKKPALAGNQAILQGFAKLNLTEEQKEKISQLQKEFETKALQVLTDEQRKSLEGAKKKPAK